MIMSNRTKNIVAILLIVLAVVLIATAIYCLTSGFDKINNYYNSENYPSLNINAYVGGDAYNFIINGTYFAGYMALGGSLLVCAAICAVTGLLLLLKSSSQAPVQVNNQDSKTVQNNNRETTSKVEQPRAKTPYSNRVNQGQATAQQTATNPRQEMGQAANKSSEVKPENEKDKRIREYWAAHKDEREKLLSKKAEAERILNNGKNLDAQTLNKVRDFIKAIDDELTKER